MTLLDSREGESHGKKNERKLPWHKDIILGSMFARTIKLSASLLKLTFDIFEIGIRRRIENDDGWLIQRIMNEDIGKAELNIKVKPMSWWKETYLA